MLFADDIILIDYRWNQKGIEREVGEMKA